MKQFKKELQKILENDPLNLLDVKKSKSSNSFSTDERLVLSFKEINIFFEEQGRIPEKSNNVEERKLYSRFHGIKEDIDKVEVLREYDKFNLLKDVKRADAIEIKTVDDILENDALGLLDKENEDIFNLKHIPKEKKKPDYIASRKLCDDFDKFEHLFKQCHVDLSAGKRKLRPFKKEQQIKKRDFFILRGIMVYIAHVGTKEKRGKKNRCSIEMYF